MKPKALGATAVLLLLPLGLYTLPASDSEHTPPVSDAEKSPRIQEEQSLLDIVAPLAARPDTGEIINAQTGKVVDNPVLNNPEARRQRILTLRAGQNPIEFWKATAPHLPPNANPQADEADMANPRAHTARARGRETAAQKRMRELSELAILDPAGYMAELKRTRAQKQRADAAATAPEF